jgi:hypothetical protein
MRATPAERDLVRRFVDFLNLDITTTTQVEDLFGAAAMVAGLMTIPADEGDAYRRDQAALRDIVQPLADAFGYPRRLQRAVRDLRPQVQAGLGDKPFPAWLSLDDAGRLRSTYSLNGVALCSWVAVGLLIDPDRGLLGRFGRCGACERFNVTLVERRKPRRHCSPAHLERFRRQTSAKRVARWRARQKRKER